MGRGLRLSALLLGVLLGLGALGYYLLSLPKKAGRSKVTRISPPNQVTNTARPEIPRVIFKDITAAAGIRFHHNNGANGEKLLPETMGGGVAFLDFDNDGKPDLLFVNSAPWPWKQSSTVPSRVPGIVLYRNETEPDNAIHFTEVSGIPDLAQSFYGMGVAAGDYDGDGWVDVLITGVGGTRLLHNEGGISFRDATTAAGVGGDPRDWSTAAAWFDFDNDGDLDLYVGNYVRWSREIDAEVGYKLIGGARAYGPPMNFQGAFPHLYRNDGGRFVDIAAESGVEDQAAGMGVSWGDSDGDGDLDLLVSNMFSSAGQRITAQARFRAADTSDLRAEFRHHALGNSLFVNAGEGAFRDSSDAAGIRMGRWAWGSQFCDLDGDGLPEIVVPNGFMTNEQKDDL